MGRILDENGVMFRDETLVPIWEKVQAGTRLSFDDGMRLFDTGDLIAVGHMADWAKRRASGDEVFFVFNRQVNPTNLCVLSCKFCDFAAKPGDDHAYEMSMDEILGSLTEDITEVHIVGGHHPEWPFERYLEIVATIHERFPQSQIKAFTAAEFDYFEKRWKVPVPEALERLKTWVKAGGTLIAIGSAAGPFIKTEGGLSAVRRRRDVLPKLAEYAYAVALERIRGATTLDPENVWDGVAETQPAEPPGDSPDKDAKAKHLDQWRRVFSPSGVIVRSELDREHWLTFSMPEKLPVFYTGSTVLMSRHPVRTAVRLAEKTRLRLSGLLWPEATARIADSAYVTTERIGNGQIILFAAEPDFRGSYHGTRRLLINAVLLGPGCGTSQPVPPP